MTIDIGSVYRDHADLAPRAVSPFMDALRGSDILAIAQQVKQLQSEGHTVRNLTIGDFDAAQFPIPDALREAIKAALDAGHTTYPPAVGMPELREAIRGLYLRDLGLDIPVDAILAGSGARPPLYAAFGVLVAEGDTVVYPVPSWNINHYTFLNKGRGVPIVTTPESGFMPTLAQIKPHLAEARMVVINSPSNPAGTVISKESLTEICDAILEENRAPPPARRPSRSTSCLRRRLLAAHVQRRRAPHADEPAPRDGALHHHRSTPSASRWAATGLRVGWCVAPPWVRAKMQALIGHMGAWAGRAEQVATAHVLAQPSLTAEWMSAFMDGISARLGALEAGITALRGEGFPVRCLRGEGAIYLSVQVDLVGRTAPDGTTLATDEDVRSYILRHAGVAVVPFPAFGFPEGSGWVRMSVGSISEADAHATVASLRAALAPFRG
jgi:aspartate aminotransferase